MSKIKIAIFFTYDYSVELLKKTGLFEREMKIYNDLHKKYNLDFIFITYDKNINFEENYNNFTFITVYKYIKESKFKSIKLLKSLTVPFKIKNDLKSVDVLHQHQLLGSWIPIILKFILKKPLLIRTGYDAYLFSINNREEWYKTLFYKLLTFYSLKYSNLYTVTSTSDYKFLLNYFKVKNIKVVPNWITEVKELREERDKSKILMVGRLEKQKNFSLALEFMNRLDNNFELDIYGSGSELDSLIEMKERYKLKVNFFSNIEHKNLIRKYQEYEYFLSTSTFEGNPKTILEAINSECIVFATNIQNHSEIIYDNENGFLFNSIDELLYKFQNVDRDENLKKYIRSNCKKSLIHNSIQKISELMYLDYKLLTSFK